MIEGSWYREFLNKLFSRVGVHCPSFVCETLCFGSILEFFLFLPSVSFVLRHSWFDTHRTNGFSPLPYVVIHPCGCATANSHLLFNFYLFISLFIYLCYAYVASVFTCLFLGLCFCLVKTSLYWKLTCKLTCLSLLNVFLKPNVNFHFLRV